jgi:transketolase
MSASSLLESLGNDVTRSLHEIAQQLRVDAVRCSAVGSAGHPVSSVSAADLMAVLLARHLRYDFTQPGAPGNDHLIFSQGQASPLLYAMLRAAGAISETELLSYRRVGSRLEGHATPRLPWIEVATGSAGQGLPVGVGIGLTGKRLDRVPYRVWVLSGDGELAEGSAWEAAEQAGRSQLDNVKLIVDVRQSGPGPDSAGYAARFRAFGWHALEIDGHDLAAIDRAFAAASARKGTPTVILARTGRPGAADPDLAIRELGGIRDLRVPVKPPVLAPVPQARQAPRPWRPPAYEPGSRAATGSAVGAALAALAEVRPEVVALDAGVSDDASGTGMFARAYPGRFFSCRDAERQMVATAIGMQSQGWVPYAATFAAFFARAFDFIRMAAVGRASIRLVGSHAGVWTGLDGPSQMGLEDLAALRAVHGSTVLSPCDANQAAWLTGVLADQPGISYLRTCRGELPVIYPPGERFRVGGSRVLRSSPRDQVTLVATGVTVHEALAAADLLAEDGIQARVIDAYSVKPVDAVTLRAAARETGRIVTVEDHWPEGGLGDAVLSALAGGGGPMPSVRKLAVRFMPGSATPEEQLQVAGIDMASIASAAVESVMGSFR